MKFWKEVIDSWFRDLKWWFADHPEFAMTTIGVLFTLLLAVAFIPNAEAHSEQDGTYPQLLEQTEEYVVLAMPCPNTGGSIGWRVDLTNDRELFKTEVGVLVDLVYHIPHSAEDMADRIRVFLSRMKTLGYGHDAGMYVTQCFIKPGGSA